MFADDVSIFSVVDNSPLHSANMLNNDLAMINNWAYKWRMSFNPDPTKQAKEDLFSRKRKDIVHPDLIFNGTKVNQAPSQKHLGMILDEKLNFNEHLSAKLSKARKSVGILRKLFYLIPRNSLVTIYKSFIRPHLDYCDFIYDKPSNVSFTDNIESIQYNAALAITGAIRGTSRDRIYQELGLESLSARRWFRRLSVFYKIKNSKSPKYLFSIIPSSNANSITRNRANIPLLSSRTEFFKNSFFPNTIKEWNNLNITIRNSLTLSSFKNNILKIIRPSLNPVYYINNPIGLKFLTRLRLNFSHLREHKFKHNFQDTLNPLCGCSLEIESTEHFFLRCLNYANERQTLLNEISKFDSTFLLRCSSDQVNILLYGKSTFKAENNFEILSNSITYILST